MIEGQALQRRHLLIISAAAAMLMITMGMRQSLGLFIAPITDSTQVGYAAMSFALAVGQLMWGASQPIFGALADRHGSGRVLIFGALLLAAGTALTPFATREWALLVTLGFLTAFGAGAGSFAVIFGVVMQRVPASKRSFASGYVNAGGSLGQFVFAPLNQVLIATIGWMGAMWTMAVTALATLPLARGMLRRPDDSAGAGIERDDAARAAAYRGARSQLLVPARRLLHLRLSHRFPGHAPSR
jgi:MFS family permease